METNYKIGRVYKIINRLTTDIYIGSTFSTLNERWRGHKKKYNKLLKKNITKCSIYDKFKKYDIQNFKIILIKEYLCYREHNKDFKHLHSKEQLWINKMKCINKVCAFNPIPRKVYLKQYNENNKDKAKEYRLKNKEKIKQYTLNNKNKRNEYNKEWRELNNIKTTCLCGSKIIKRRVKEHEKSKKHINFINNQNK